MKTLNQLINEYTLLLQKGEMQAAYKGILDFIGKLRTDFIKRFQAYDVSSIYQGYMDMTYFSLSTKQFKDRGLKIAVVYLHEKGTFEVWLSARNRELAKRYESILKSNISDNISAFHDGSNQDAIIECTLTSEPNFDDPAMLIESIEQGVEKFVAAVAGHL